jgi:hypothetical protein
MYQSKGMTIHTKTKRLKQIAVTEENWKALSLLGHTNETFKEGVMRLLHKQATAGAVSIRRARRELAKT